MLLPTVLNHQKSDDSLTLMLEIDPKIEFFKGHFDETPIIPGVAQLYWALEFYIKYFQPSSRPVVSNISALKFQQVIPPHSQIILTMNYSDQKNLLAFSFTSDSANYSSGKITLD